MKSQTDCQNGYYIGCLDDKRYFDTEKHQYPATREWAEAIHRQCPAAQGLAWISRQDDSARAFFSAIAFLPEVSGNKVIRTAFYKMQQPRIRCPTSRIGLASALWQGKAKRAVSSGGRQ
ncbi:RES domain-containing protein [Pantoea sp. B65]